MIAGLGSSALLLPGHRLPAVAALASVEPPPQARVWGGVVSGYWADTRRQIAAFKGIPYGDDTRQTRFQPPRRLTARWDKPRASVEWGPRCPQMNVTAAPNPLGAGFSAIEGAPIHYHLPPDEGYESEDCLNLNVWTPAFRRGKAEGKPRPVLVYFHGGAYSNGTVNAALYDGTRLAANNDIVLVTVNHRLNAFGYMYLAGEAGLETSYKESGNVGMLDLVLALEWVRENVAAFGGDWSRVTIFGQSGGGAKCATLMAMPAAKGLFHRVWTMSGQQVTAVPPQMAARRTAEALAALEITVPVTADTLNSLTVQQIQLAARAGKTWMPVRDNAVLLRDPFKPDAPSQSAAMPMVLGNTKDEVLAAGAWRFKDLTWERLPIELTPQIAPYRGTYTVDEIIATYRKWHPEAKPVDVYVDTVAVFRSWPGQVIEAEMRAQDPTSARRTWVYQMNYPSATANGYAPHTLDIAFVFDNLALAPGMIGAEEADLKAAQPVATAMSRALTQLARTGEPDGGGLTVWPPYDLATRRTMIFDRTVRVESDPRGKERAMMAEAHYRQPGT